LKIRNFKATDRQGLSELFLQTRKESWFWLDASKWKLDDFSIYTQDEMILVAEADQKYMGFASIYRQDHFLHHLFVAPEYQHQGIGSALLHAAEAMFTDVGYLKCLVKNKQALSFYIRHQWDIKSLGHSAEGDYFLMEKKISSAKGNNVH